MAAYLRATQRGPIADKARAVQGEYLAADRNAEYDEVITIDLSTLEPHLNGPFTPDLSTPISAFKEAVQTNDWPTKLHAGLIGSCTNSSYQDMQRCESLVKQATAAGLKPKSDFLITPGSEQIRATLEKEGTLETFEKAGGTILANACGPCIGQWKRSDIEKGEKNAILTSYNRNFRSRNDANPNTLNFLTSPELVTAMSFAGTTTFNPLTDSIETPDGKQFKFEPPTGAELPATGFASGNPDFYPSFSQPDPSAEVIISPTSTRLAPLEPFAPYGEGELDMTVLIKIKGKCTTDTISAAGSWLKYKGHLENLSHNTLFTAVNAETDEVNVAYDINGKKMAIPELAHKWKKEGRPWLVVGEYNYGEGSAREHAALQPRYLGARVILCKSFARIHETNLKKQGMIPLTFENESDYDIIKAGDTVRTEGLYEMLQNGGKGDVSLIIEKRRSAKVKSALSEVVSMPGSARAVKASEKKKVEDPDIIRIPVKHTISEDQAKFILAGSALNLLSAQAKANAAKAQ